MTDAPLTLISDHTGVNGSPPKRKQVSPKVLSQKNRWQWVLAFLPTLSLLIVGAAIFRQFLFGDAVLLYKDIGSDSLISYYPDFVQLSHYIRTEGYPSWSFYVGMGQDLAYATGYLIWQPVSWLPKAWIAPALVFQHLLKVLLAGLLFFRFLQLRGLRSPAPVLGALLLSFSAYMCMASCSYYPLADEVVCFVAILLGAERAMQNGRWLLLAFAVALVGMINPFHLYLCALFLVCYVPATLFGRYAWQPRIIASNSLTLAAIATLGVGLGAFVTLPYLDAVMNSPRGSGTTSPTVALQSSPMLGFESSRHYVTALFRPFANDMLGTADDFHGWQNYLEAPLTYCGLISLVLLPQVFRGGTRRDRFLFLLLLAALLIPTVFPWFRYLFWLFQGDYYRTYSLFWILSVITLGLIAFSRYIGGGALNLWLLAATTAVLIATLYLPITEPQMALEPGLRRAATMYLVLYTMLLTAGQLIKRQKLAACCILPLVAMELVHFDHITVSHRQTVSKRELNMKVGYNDETVEAVRDINSGDSSFFRITKPRSSAPTSWSSLNDAMVFGYYGTASYNSFNNVNYTSFLTMAGAIPPRSELNTRWSIGLLDNPLLSTFACEKYALVDEPALYEKILSYRFVRKYGRDYLFYNQLFVPLGLTFTRYITEDEFSHLPAEERPQALFRAVVLPADEAEKRGLQALSTSELESEIKDIPLGYVIAARREGALNLTSFHQRRIEGTIQLAQKSILVVQTPFDRGWVALENGKAAPVEKVDAGLLGVALEPGEHRIELRYRNPLLLPGVAVTIASLCLLGGGLWQWPRLRLSA